MRGAFTCVGWQVTLCDPIWQVTLCSSVMGFQSIKSYTQLYLYPIPLLNCFYVLHPSSKAALMAQWLGHRQQE